MSYPLGRISSRAVDIDDFMSFALDAIPAPAPSVTAPNLVYPMACNDQEGDCTIAAVVHTDQATASLESETYVYPGDPAVHTEYRTLSGGGDTGLAEPVVLSKWSAKPNGLFGKVLYAYAPLNVKHTKAIKQVVGLVGAVYTGVLVPSPAQEQFQDHQPWHLTHTSADSDIEGGHAVPIVGYSATGPIVVTWGQLQEVTWEWWLTYAEESYAVITEEIAAKGSLHGFDLAALKRDIDSLKATA